MASLLIAVIFSLFTLLEAHLTLLRQLFDFSRREQNIIKLLIFFGQWNKDDKNDSVEARQNLDGSGEGQDELQRSGTTLICREDSNGERIGREIIREHKVWEFSIRIRVVVWTGENDTRTISVDANRFKTEQNSTVFIWKWYSVDGV